MPPGRLQPVAAWGLVGGQHNNVPPTRVPDNGMSESYNVLVSEGRLKPRPGLEEHAATGSTTACNHLSTYQIGSTIYLVRTQLNTGTNALDIETWDGATWTSRVTGLTGGEDTPPWSVQIKGEFLILPGGGDLYRATAIGTWATVDSAQADATLEPPNTPRVMGANLSRVFLGDGVDQVSGNRIPYRAWWCSKSDTLTWSHGAGKPEEKNAGFQDLMYDNSPIVGFHYADAREFLCAKERSIYQAVFKGPPLFYEFEPISTSHGCGSGHTMCSWQGLVVWMGQNGNVYAKQVGSPQIIAIGDAIRPRLNSILNSTYARRASAVIDPALGLYYLFVPKSGSATVSYMFICALKDGFAWAEGEISHADIRVMHAHAFYAGVNDTRLLVASRDGKVYRLSGTTLADGGTNFEAYFWSKTMDFLEIQTKRSSARGTDNAGTETLEIQKISLMGDSGTATGRVRAGATPAAVESATAVEFGDFDMSQTTGQSYKAEGAGRVNAFRFAQVGAYWDGGTTAPMALDGVTFWGMPRGEARE